MKTAFVVKNEDHICDLCGEGGLEWVQFEVTTEHSWSQVMICIDCGAKIAIATNFILGMVYR
jgi:hypothetical protein